MENFCLYLSSSRVFFKLLKHNYINKKELVVKDLICSSGWVCYEVPLCEGIALKVKWKVNKIVILLLTGAGSLSGGVLALALEHVCTVNVPPRVLCKRNTRDKGGENFSRRKLIYKTCCMKAAAPWIKASWEFEVSENLLGCTSFYSVL